MRPILIAVLLLAACGPGPAPTPHPSGTVASSVAGSPGVSGDVCHANGITYCVLNPAVTQANIKQTICVSGWTKTVRPPISYTDQLKAKQVHDLGLAGNLSDYEEDHRMPLELGGSPKDPKNLSPELGASPNPKDRNEDSLKVEVCAGRMTLAVAQQNLIAKWLGPYPAYRQ